MRILVISDTHGSIERAKLVYDKLNQEKKVDIIVHCGDYSSDARELQKKVDSCVIYVKGNCDGSYDEDDYELIETDAGNIIVTHGHMQNIGYSLEPLYDFAKEHNASVVLFGHTHRNIFTDLYGIYMMNPGSLTKPRDNTSGTFGVLEITDAISGKIYTYDNFMKGNPDKPKIKTGHLSSLINYSDRF